MIRSVFRYKKADLFLLSSFIVTSLCLMLLVVVYSENERYKRDLINCNYNSSVQIVLEQMEEADVSPIENLLDDLDGIIMIQNWIVYSKTAQKSLCVNILISCSEELKIPFRDTTSKEFINNPNGIVLGDVTKRYLGFDRKLFELGGEDFEYMGTCGSKYSTYGYDQTYIWYGGIKNAFRESINHANTLTVLFQSDKSSADLFVQTMKDRTEQQDFGWKIQSVSHYQESDVSEDDTTKRVTYVILLIFSFLNCWVAIRYWLLVREKEIYVRLVNGSTEGLVIKMLYFQAVKLSFTSLLCASGIAFVLFRMLYANRLFDVVGVWGVLLTLLFTLTTPFLLIVGNVWAAFRKKRIKWG